MDFTVNFMDSTSAVWKEAVKVKKYKAMPLVLAIVTGVLMLPVAIAGALVTVCLYVLGYLFSVISLPAQKLHKLLHDEGQSLKHASQFIIYFLSWTFVFSTYAALSFFMILLNVLYTVFAILTYIWTLGGFKFHPFAGKTDISVEVSGKYSLWIPLAFIAGMGILLLLLPLIKTILIAVDFPKGMTGAFKAFLQTFKYQFQSLNSWRFLFSAVFSAAVFAPFPRTKDE